MNIPPVSDPPARLHNASMPVASTDVTSVERATFLEHCYCPEGYEGLSCERCAKGYRRVNNTLVNGICEKCPCHNHVDSCDPYTARCGVCLHNTVGPNCERCRPGFYGDATTGEADACKPCACPLSIASNNFADGCQSTSATGECSSNNNNIIGINNEMNNQTNPDYRVRVHQLCRRLHRPPLRTLCRRLLRQPDSCRGKMPPLPMWTERGQEQTRLV